MEIILNYKNGDYILEKIEDNRKTRTNNQEKIKELINHVPDFAIRATYYNNSVNLFFGDNKYITLSNYKNNKDLDLYLKITNCITENTRVIKNVNKTKLKAIPTAVLIAISLVSVSAVSGKENNKPNTTIENISPTIIPSPTITPIPTKEPVLTPTPIIEQTKNFNDRYTESMLMSISNKNDYAGIPLATKFNEYYCNRVLECFNSDIWNFSNKYGSDFGVDPYLGLSLFYVETNFEHEKTLPGGSSYNGAAVGIGQHENPNGTNSVTAFNYNTNQYETEIISMENACDLEKNIKMTFMLLQNKLKKYNGNIYVTIQSYNYGDGAMNYILEKYAQEQNITKEDVLSNYSDIGWLKYVEDFHNNPGQYLSNWNYNTYGDPNYVKKVMGYYVGSESTNTLPDGTKETINLVTLEKTYEEKIR